MDPVSGERSPQGKSAESWLTIQASLGCRKRAFRGGISGRRPRAQDACSSSRRSHALAKLQRRRTVATDMSSASAASSRDSPAK